MAAQSVPNVAVVMDPRGGYREITTQEMEAAPISQFYNYKGNIVNAQSKFYYDTAYIKTGVAVPANAKQSLFTLGKAETSIQFGTSTTTGEKTEFLTNMTNNGYFDNGVNFIMEGAGVQIIQGTNNPTTVAANGAITAPNYTASVVIDATNNLLMALENLELRFIRGEDVKKRGTLKFWPSAPGVGLEGAIGSPNAGFVQNSRQGLVQFSNPVVLESGDKFQFDLANVAQAAWTPTVDMKVVVVIWGTALTRQYPG